MWAHIVIFVAVLASSANAVVMPGVLEVDPCRVTDKECVLDIWKTFMSVIVAGYEKFDVKKMDPFFVDKIVYDYPEYTISEEVLNATIDGLRYTVLEDFEYNKEEKFIIYKYLTNLRLSAISTTTYHNEPQLKREGSFKMWLHNLTIVVHHDFDHRIVNEKKYLQLLTTNVTDVIMPIDPVYDNVSLEDIEHIKNHVTVIWPILAKVGENVKAYQKKFAMGFANQIAELITYNHMQFSNRIPMEEYYIE